jgi:hypothetical protein
VRRFPCPRYGSIASACREHGLDRLNRGVYFLIGHRLDRARVLDLKLARDKVTENLHVTERALLPTFLNRLAAVRLKIEQERLEKFLVKQVTRVVPD